MQIEERNASWLLALIMLLTFVAGTNTSAGQQVGKTPPPTLAVDTLWPVVNINVVVLDKDRAARRVVDPGFQLLEDGTERPIRVVGSAESPVSLALMVDLSGSIFKRKDAIIVAVKALVKTLPEHSEVMLVDFSYLPFLDITFTDVSKADFSVLDRLQANGGTALYDAIAATETEVMTHAKYPRRALVIFSDGEDNASRISKAQVLRRMARSGAPAVYLCDTAKANVFQQDRMVGHLNMKFLAKVAGGTEFNLEPDAGSAAAKIADAIRNQYVLQFTAADGTRNGKPRKLAVRLTGEDVQIHGLPVYLAPAE